MQYLELTGREAEFVALSRDTTESDLKQRREIRDGTAHYVDQVKALLFGFSDTFRKQRQKNTEIV